MAFIIYRALIDPYTIFVYCFPPLPLLHFIPDDSDDAEEGSEEGESDSGEEDEEDGDEEEEENGRDASDLSYVTDCILAREDIWLGFDVFMEDTGIFFFKILLIVNLKSCCYVVVSPTCHTDLK